jgi:hypothetical protein
LSTTVTIKSPNPPPLSNKPLMCVAGGWLLLVVEIGDEEGSLDAGLRVLMTGRCQLRLRATECGIPQKDGEYVSPA